MLAIKDKGSISVNTILYATGSLLVGFGVWIVNQVSAVKVDAAQEKQKVEDVVVDVSGLKTSIDALNVKVDNTNHTLDNIAGVLGIKKHGLEN